MTLDETQYAAFYDYLSQKVMASFYERRLQRLRDLRLHKVLRNKNPYLFRAKNLLSAQDMVKSMIDAYLSSQEETIFGNLLEGVAINLAEQLYGGTKSKRKSLDLEFRRDGKYYMVSIKSGIHWGNADQISAMKMHFKAARQDIAGQEKISAEDIVAVNGCMYGTDGTPLKISSDASENYYRYAGQDFWAFITQDDYFYRKMIAHIGQAAQSNEDVFMAEYSAKITEMTTEFLRDFATQENSIDWEKLIDHASKRG